VSANADLLIIRCTPLARARRPLPMRKADQKTLSAVLRAVALTQQLVARSALQLM
jgi:hypothetical protein